MSDGSLSQEEIDSLLAGLDGGPSAPAPAAPTRFSSALSPQDAQAFKAILDATVSAQSQNLSMIAGLSVTVQPPQVDGANRDAFLRDVPEEVLAVSVPFTGSLPGDHCFVMAKQTALRIASLANKDEGLSDLDDMALSAVQECISTLAGTQVTVISEKTGNRNIATGVAEASFGPKAMARVPGGDFLRASYPVQFGDGQADRIVELFALGFVRDVLASAGGGAGGGFGGPGSGMGAGGFGGQQSGSQGQSGGMAAMGGMGGSFGGMGQAQGGYGSQMGMQGYGGMAGMNPPNVQPVQFAGLQVQHASPESGNIGLIMDVNMEMTVELGRTRKLIKEILGMGEGTIIELDKLAGEPVDILVNHKLIAKGEVVVIDENFGVRVTEIVSPMERMSDLG